MRMRIAMKMNTSGKYTSMVDFLQLRLRAFAVFYVFLMRQRTITIGTV